MPYADPIKRREYHRAYNRRWQQEHRDWIRAYSKEYRSQDKEKARARTKQHEARKECNRIKNESKQRPCTDCTIQYPFYVMDFDHIPERGPKLFDISTYHGGEVTKLRAEIAKCDVVCANCHRERTWQRSQRKEE